ncbi:S41 family peptidase [uncultured Draconibacterium sp.]|uniref:S41 family peptidase n=1 Tax=uncultured Draconibacterium sp. TaxID=1573823 RepID=UPI0025D04A13|nr:S41 family peptidase [uncultured Draconibacterium sp.]
MQPTISPDGSEIAFSFQGDIWIAKATAENPKRLTLHEAYEGNPVWSDDGKQVIFSSDRFGNNDLFKIAAAGGTPIRLTYNSANDLPASIMPNGAILFNTGRNYLQIEREPEIYILKEGAATETRFMDALGSEPVSSPDGTKIAFVRGTCRIAREAYNGPANRDIWVYDITKDEYQQITTHGTNDFAPQWLNNNELVFISGRNGRYNIYKADESGTMSLLTNEKDFGIFSFSLSRESNKIAYQTAKQSFIFNLSDNTKTAINVDIATDYRFDPVVKENTKNKVDEFALSPNGKFIAYSVRGELFVTRNDSEDDKAVRLTNTSARDINPVWLNDETLLFISDAEGQNDLYMLTSTDEEVKDLFYSFKREITRLTKTTEEESKPLVSPDGEKVAILQGRGTLIVFSIDKSGNLGDSKILLDDWATPNGITWSPDSKWLAYSKPDLDFNNEVFIHAADNSQAPVNVSMHPKRDANPVWSKDGSKLGFVSERNNGDSDIWFVWLKKEDWEKSKAEWTRNEKEAKDKTPEKDKKEEDNKGDDTEDKQEKEKDIEIDFDKMYQRIVQVTKFAGGETDFAFDDKGEFIYYTNGAVRRLDYVIDRSLFKIKWDGSDKKEIKGIKNPTGLQTTPLKGKLYFKQESGVISALDLKSDKIEKLSVSSELRIRYKEELSQIFEEGWRTLGAVFYDPQFHGQDWEALKANYKPIALAASSKQDFRWFFNLMLGQLNASHMGLYGDNPQKETQRELTGKIGIEGEAVQEGFKISRIVANSPADREESKLKIGDIITAVNMEAVVPTANFFALMEGTSNERTLLNIKRGEQNEEILIWPGTSLGAELYDEWVEARRALVDEYSNGKLGYLHIQGMNWTSFERFERELMAAGYGKEGIVIDVRYNGGGWTTDYLMTVLSVRQHAYTVPRGASENPSEQHKDFRSYYPFGERLPLTAWTKPSIALCNEASYSNAEIFSHAYKTLGLGTLVGQPTFGAVISTGSTRLQDGSRLRLPTRGWYVKATDENMENGPAVPNILVENPPAYKAKNVDPQLKKAVEQLISEMEK